VPPLSECLIWRPAAGLVGAPISGRIDLDASFGGSVQRPTVGTQPAAPRRASHHGVERLGADCASRRTERGARWDITVGPICRLSGVDSPLPTVLGDGRRLDAFRPPSMQPPRRHFSKG